MLIVEDGTGKADAESYASVDDADAYHVARANSAWALLDAPAKEASLRKATDYLEAVYTGEWQGVRTTTGQMLEWPRANVPALAGTGYEPSNAIPRRLIMATCELALKASAGVLLKDEEQRVAEESVGPLSVKYADGAPAATQYSMVANLLGPYLAATASAPGSASGQVRLVRR